MVGVESHTLRENVFSMGTSFYSLVMKKEVRRIFKVAVILSTMVIYSCDNDSNGTNNVETIIPESSYKAIEIYLDSLVLDNVESSSLSRNIEAKYKYIKGSDGNFNILKNQTVYLYYDGLRSGGLWDKPGAKAFGGSRVSTVHFINGPVKATVVAHKELEGGRNYFYIFVSNEIQGWMGRPYIHQDKNGSKFLMPNPLTGEEIREKYIASSKLIANKLKTNTSSYIPAYDSINWGTSIPIKYRRRGYELYQEALSDGHSQVDRLVSKYLSTH